MLWTTRPTSPPPLQNYPFHLFFGFTHKLQWKSQCRLSVFFSSGFQNNNFDIRITLEIHSMHTNYMFSARRQFKMSFVFSQGFQNNSFDWLEWLSWNSLHVHTNLSAWRKCRMHSASCHLLRNNNGDYKDSSFEICFVCTYKLQRTKSVRNVFC